MNPMKYIKHMKQMNLMNKVMSAALLVVAATFCLLAAAPAGAPAARVSPHETIYSRLESNRVMIVYGRPYSKDPRSGEIRKIWGGLVPYGKWWRAGSDEATLFITQKALDFSGTAVPAGAYTLFMLPNEDGTAKLIINKQLGQWGLEYDEKQDFARVDMKKEAMEPQIDQFTIAEADCWSRPAPDGARARNGL